MLYDDPVRVFAVILILGGCVRPGAEPAPPPRHELTVVAGPGGRVTSEPAGISCGQVCTAEYRQGRVVTLRVAVDPGVEFAGWTGACAGRRLCTLHITDAVRVAARFVVAGTDRPVPESMRRPSDLDDDGVPDDRDECPVEAGAGDGDGCPEDS